MNKKQIYNIIEKNKSLLRFSSRLFVSQPNLKETPLKILKEEWNTALPFDKVPGPTSFELLRGFMPGGKYRGSNRNDWYTSMREEYGDIYKLPSLFGSPSLIFIFNPTTFERVYRTEGVWPSRRHLDTMEYYRKHYNPEPFKNCGTLLTTNGEEWGSFRSSVNPVLMQPKTIGMYAPKMDNAASEFINRIKKIKDPKTNEAPANFEREINNWAIESICLVALETRLNVIDNKDENPDISLLIESLDKIFNIPVELEFKPSIWKWYKTPKFNELMIAFDNLTKISQKYINQAFERIQNNPSNDDVGASILERLLKVDKNVATVMALEMFFAGTDTTTSALTACLLALSKNPDKQEILRKEILNVLPSKNTPITKETLNHLPYLRAVIKESLRVHPVVFEQARATGIDVVLEGYQIPKGTEAMMLAVDLLKNENHFSNPTKFLPERWLREQSEIPNSSEINEKSKCPMATKSSNPFVFLPFGFGPRMCIGKRLVNMEIEIVLMRILRNFKIEYDYPADEVFQLELISKPKAELKFKFNDI